MATKEELELQREADEMALQEGQEPLNAKVKRGRPPKPNTIKTNLDLTEALLVDLDQVSNYLGTSRQALIKSFILEGLDRHFTARKKA